MTELTRPVWFPHRTDSDQRRWLLVSALCSLLAVIAATALPPRTALIASLTACLCLAVVGTDSALTVAFALIPIIAFLRRVTSGPLAYTENDVLATVPAVVVAVFLLRERSAREPLTRRPRSLVALCWWLGLVGLLAVSRAGATGLYGLLVQLPPVLVALFVVRRSGHRFATLSRRSLVVLGPVVGAYGLLQYVSPAEWDLQWLRTLGPRVISTGVAVPGRFRIFGTMEGPGPYAMYLGLACIALAVTAGRVASRSRVAALALASTGGALFCILALTAVRAALIALPVALIAVLVIDRRIPRWVAFLGAGVALVAAVTLPQVLPGPQVGSVSQSRQRLGIGALGEDQSFRDRVILLPALADAVRNPVGQGLGTSGLGARLSGSGGAPVPSNAGAAGEATAGTANVDNGYLARAGETGGLGLLLFLVVHVAAIRRVGLRVWRTRRAPDDVYVLATLTFFTLAELSGPQIASSLGVFYWVAVGAALAGTTDHRSADNRHADVTVP